MPNESIIKLFEGNKVRIFWNEALTLLNSDFSESAVRLARKSSTLRTSKLQVRKVA